MKKIVLTLSSVALTLILSFGFSHNLKDAALNKGDTWSPAYELTLIIIQLLLHPSRNPPAPFTPNFLKFFYN
ncbi:Phr family secreted Rap phosphatase inhibitor [Bacillus sp. C30]|uniref:Phr family secreted Rap phosphatase inhibitor n=1 Tax=Bacillus sp. C30 TaxID=1387733 RepID=UPI00349F7F44